MSCAVLTLWRRPGHQFLEGRLGLGAHVAHELPGLEHEETSILQTQPKEEEGVK
jgi:hypothetical protein